MAESTPVEDARPPRAVLKVANPLMRTLVSSPIGRVLPIPWVVLEFAGRRTGQRYRIVVGCYDAGGQRVAFTPARWRLNFRGGAPVTVIERGRRRAAHGELVEDYAEVAATMQRILDAGVKPRDLGLKMPAGHRLTADDLAANGRQMLQIEPA
jgi:hypothetical protein